MLHEKTIDTINIINEVFDEFSSQSLYIEGKGSTVDLRLLNYVLFAKKIIHGFGPTHVNTRSTIEEVLSTLHFDIWEDFLFEKNNGLYHYDDCCWILLKVEKQLLGTNAIYEQFWNDGATKARNAHQLSQLLEVLEDEQRAIQQGSTWKIKDKTYIIGAPFGLSTDLWVYPVDEINHTAQSSYRLSDFMPLSSKDFKLIRLNQNIKV